MNLMQSPLLSVVILLQVVSAQSWQQEPIEGPIDDYLQQLQHPLAEILIAAPVERCSAVITDEVHHMMYERSLLQRSGQLRPQLYLKLGVTEDLLAPHYQTVRMLTAMRTFNCDLYLVTILNAVQTKRFLRFVHTHRVLRTRQKFVMVHDTRLLGSEMLPIWRNMASTVFVKKLPERNQFSIFTVSYPNVLSGIIVMEHVADWKPGRRLKSAQIFPNKVSDLKGTAIPVAVVQHVPMVYRHSNNEALNGVEVEIVHALGEVLNFKPIFYASNDSEDERGGRMLPNGSYTGLMGEMISRNARLAIGDLHFNKLYSSVMDLSAPHSTECLTFLTPESSDDHSWKTLIQPFSSGMWVGVLLSLFTVGTSFYAVSWLHALALRHYPNGPCHFFSPRRQRASDTVFDRALFRDVKFRVSLNRLQAQPRRQDIFDSFPNCILLTYSMQTYVALPRMPRNGPLRVLSAWYWIYCILLTVAYRASFTAILANPAARITIDTLEELANSRITPIAWGEEKRKFFTEAFDAVAQEIGLKLELINDTNGVTDYIAKGTHAYYDNEFHLRHLRLQSNQRREYQKVLHVMQECVVRMPTVLGLEKNSPLKPAVDIYLQRLREGGLLSKWLVDATRDLPVEDQELPEALMDLHKFWSSLVVLAVGSSLGAFALIAERLHFKYVVQRHPLYDRYNSRLYYNYKRRFENS